VIIIQNGERVHLTSKPMEYQPTSDRRPSLTVISQRIADGLCTGCGAPDLASDIHCQRCLDKRANRRHGAGEIG
jgi:hypothetical protein